MKSILTLSQLKKKKKIGIKMHLQKNVEQMIEFASEKVEKNVVPK